MTSFLYDLVKDLPGLTGLEDAYELYARALMVPENGYILELGSFLGKSATVLAMAAPTAKIISVDTYDEAGMSDIIWAWMGVPRDTVDWSPEGNIIRLAAFGIHNVEFIKSDSEIAPVPDGLIDLLWIDCNHTYEYTSRDLRQYGLRATTIMLHDYENGGKEIDKFPGVTRAVNEFLLAHPEFHIERHVASMVTLCK